jgi:hypothetical protein
MSYQNPPIPESERRREYQYAVAHEKLQADPELAAAEGRAGPLLITAYFVVAAFFVCVVLYGLNHQRNEAEETGATAAAPTENSSAPPAPTQQPNTQQGNQGGPNPPAKQPQAQPQQNPPPAKQQAKPTNGQPAPPNAQQNQPAQPAQNQSPAAKQNVPQNGPAQKQ